MMVPRAASPRLPPDAAPVTPGRQFANLVHARKKPKQPADHQGSFPEAFSPLALIKARARMIVPELAHFVASTGSRAQFGPKARI
jgi:hypothetical protein